LNSNFSATIYFFDFSLARYTLPNFPFPNGRPISKFLRDQSESFLGLLEVGFTKKGMHELISHGQEINIKLNRGSANRRS